MKKCSKCKIDKPLTEFRKDKRGKNGLSARCKICRNKQDKDWRINNPEKKRLSDKRWYQNNKEKSKEYAKEWVEKNPEKRKKILEKHAIKYREYYREQAREYRRLYPEKEKEKSRRYYIKNKDTSRERLKKWRKENPEKEKAQARRRDRIRMQNPKWRIHISIRSAINKALKGKKAGRSWESLVGYTLEDLMVHLEKQFESWMTWENYGKWHIDHIRPRSSFNFEIAEDKEFKECWSLNNLQPLEGRENIIKGDKYKK